MALHEFDLDGIPEVVDPAHNLVHTRGVLRLRRKNASGVWDPEAPFVASGNLVLPAWSPRGLTALTGFIAYADVDGNDALLFRLSPDGGVTPLWWDGAAWSVATDPILHWNTELDIDAHIATFPVGSGVTQIVRFVSSDGTTSPELKATVISYEVDYDSVVDFLDSFARQLAASVKVRGEFLLQGASLAATLTIDDPIWTVNDPVQVFNVTVDPNMRTNLFVSRVGNVVTLSAPQTGNLFARYVGTLDLTRIHIATDVDFEKAELPAIVIQTPTVAKIRYEKTNKGLQELLRSRNVMRFRDSPAFEAISTLVQCSATQDLHARKLRDAVWRFLEGLNALRSRALDENMPRSSIGPGSYSNDLVQQVITFGIPVTFQTIDWSSQFVEDPLVATTSLNLWLTPEIPAKGSQDADSVSITEPEPETVPKAPGSSVVEIAFAFSDASPIDFGDFTLGGEILNADLVIDIPFDDLAATLALGFVSSPGNILPSSAIDPTVVGTYNQGADFTIAAGDRLRLQIVPGASTKGSGRVYIEVLRA